jgi:hypothetical protein
MEHGAWIKARLEVGRDGRDGIRGQKSEVGRQRTEDGRQTTEFWIADLGFEM